MSVSINCFELLYLSKCFGNGTEYKWAFEYLYDHGAVYIATQNPV